MGQLATGGSGGRAVLAGTAGACAPHTRLTTINTQCKHPTHQQVKSPVAIKVVSQHLRVARLTQVQAVGAACGAARWERQAQAGFGCVQQGAG